MGENISSGKSFLARNGSFPIKFGEKTLQGKTRSQQFAANDDVVVVGKMFARKMPEPRICMKCCCCFWKINFFIFLNCIEHQNTSLEIICCFVILAIY